MAFRLCARLLAPLLASGLVATGCSGEDSGGAAAQGQTEGAGGGSGAQGTELPSGEPASPARMDWIYDCDEYDSYVPLDAAAPPDLAPPEPRTELCLPLEAFTRDCAPARLKAVDDGQGAGGADGSGSQAPAPWEPPVDTVSACPSVSALEFDLFRGCGGHYVAALGPSVSPADGACCYQLVFRVNLC